MDRSTYSTRIAATLAEHAEVARHRLTRIAEAVGPEVDEIEVGVFVSQDLEGSFSVQATLIGSDSYVLNRRIEQDRTLFEVVHGEEGPEPDVPFFPLGGPATFDLPDTLLEVVTTWVDELWAKVPHRPDVLCTTVVG